MTTRKVSNSSVDWSPCISSSKHYNMQWICRPSSRTLLKFRQGKIEMLLTFGEFRSLSPIRRVFQWEGLFPFQGPNNPISSKRSTWIDESSGDRVAKYKELEDLPWPGSQRSERSLHLAPQRRQFASIWASRRRQGRAGFLLMKWRFALNLKQVITSC